MLKKILFGINLIRGIPAYFLVKLSGCEELLRAETKRYLWFLEEGERKGFFYPFLLLLWRYDCFRNQVIYRCGQRSGMAAKLLQLLYPRKKDLEIDGDIGEGLVIYHGHGTVIAPHKIGEKCAIYQGVTIGRNPKPGCAVCNPTIGNNVEIFANAVVAGGITIGDNVQIGAGAVVMKDVPSNAVVVGNPCVIRVREVL